MQIHKKIVDCSKPMGHPEHEHVVKLTPEEEAEALKQLEKDEEEQG